ncbi:uncharacterized protein PgNI_09191 [Pyricularia grisea]|uniref:Endosomal peripheral membrane protein n=1 Tax=Pyricularia grisea TaxID=148305 RepID=A0A6P8AS60_PYRGI|nr:uncharacterized protein PgNI_09191 [Pyricularia grisea]TLD04948.1 hypothetical protein PgNI_09191 [Pyricularia grisea]
MTAQLLATELTNLIQESKRKHNDLRQAAERSLEELRSLNISSEAQLGPELTQKTNFANPFIIACGTKNAKFTGIAIVCLQRLIVSKALPRPRLNQVLEALQGATSAGLDVQLKILQALPSLLQNYSSDIRGELLVTALNICFILQSSKNAIVNNTSAATLQQLVVTVFDKVVTEDRETPDGPTVGEAPTDGGVVSLKPAAMDAYRVFNDLCLLTESQRPEYLGFTGLPQTFGLELIESVLTNHASTITSHPEQAHILQTRVMPFIVQSLGAKLNFPTTVRFLRILYTILRRHLTLLPSECGEALDILTRLLDQETLTWKRSLCMEVFRGIFSDAGLLRKVYSLFDAREGQQKVLKNLMATFVRVSTEKPNVIGLGQQSTIPVANPYSSIGATTDQAMLDAAGVGGIISGPAGSEGYNTGISTQWSSVRVPCIDQLDKTEPPSIPESYIYSLTLACITSLSEGLAKFILPLTIADRSKRRGPKADMGAGSGRNSPAPPAEETMGAQGKWALERTSSYKRNPVPVNPLLLEDHPLHTDIKICANIVDECWPAILATCSTFLTSALDSEYYHGLVRAFQKFAHVAGLLQLTIPRDAFLTTLGKAAVPPNVLTACLSGPGARPQTPTGSDSANSLLGNARGILSADNLQNPDRPRQGSVVDVGPATLNTRNMLCLRALLNLGIALGPTLEESWRILLETLQQADFVLFASSKVAGRVPTATRTPDQQADSEAQALLGNFNTEVKAVETAASRLFESTVDFSNKSFVEVVKAVCDLLDKPNEPGSPAVTRPESPASSSGNDTLRTPGQRHRRTMSSMSVSAAPSAAATQQDQFALAKLGDLASINLERLLTYPPADSGWMPLVSELIGTLSSATVNAAVRSRAADILVRFVLECVIAVAGTPDEVRGAIQLRLFEALRDSLLPLQMPNRDITVSTHSTDVEIHKIILEGLKSILENCGESLLSGWDITFEIIDSIFLRRRFEPTKEEDETKPPEALMTRSIKLIKPSFDSLQLICSDFLASLPNSCFLLLVDTLFKFCSQDDDLNVALTTVTFFWAISDFLSSKSRSLSITEDMVEGTGDSALVDLASDPKHPAADAALWMLLLLRLTNVTTDQRLELRNSAIQTLLRIIHAYGSSLSPEAWSICIKSVIFRLLTFIQTRLGSAHKDSRTVTRSDWDETAVVVINGVSDLLSNYLEVLLGHSGFKSIWSDLLQHFANLLDLNVLDINSAIFNSLGKILSKVSGGSQRRFDKEAVDLAWNLWSRSLPVPPPQQIAGDNQKCLVSWIEALLELYRLIHETLDVERVRRLLALVREAMIQATPGSYASDIEYVTPLQGKILDVLRTVRTDISGSAPSAMISQTAEFVAFAFDPSRTINTPTQKRTYVAMSKESMRILHYHVTNNAADADMFASGAFHAALEALARPIVMKYSFGVVTKSIQPWREATEATLAILETTLPHLKAASAEDVPRDRAQAIWHSIVEISNGIISANCDSAPSSADLEADEVFDVDSFQRLRELIVPALGGQDVAEKTRKAFAEGLFQTSIMHELTPAESQVMQPNGCDVQRGLGMVLKARDGRTVDPVRTRRAKMAGVCLEELFALVEAQDDEMDTPSIVVHPPTPRFLKSAKPTTTDSKGSDRLGDGMQHNANINKDRASQHVQLARTTAPYLILRCALTLRAYIADQPLRGRMPQPLGERAELTRVLQGLVELRSESEAIPDLDGVESETRKHLLRLYPLLVGAARVSGRIGDGKVLGLVGEALGVVGGEFGL